MLDTSMVAAARQRLLQVIRPSRFDWVFIAANPINRNAVYEGWPGATYRFASGENGADLEIFKAFSSISRLSEFSHLLIASGDGGLEPIARAAMAANLKILIIANEGSVSGKYKKYEMSQIKGVQNVN